MVASAVLVTSGVTIIGAAPLGLLYIADMPWLYLDLLLVRDFKNYVDF